MILQPSRADEARDNRGTCGGRHNKRREVEDTTQGDPVANYMTRGGDHDLGGRRLLAAAADNKVWYQQRDNRGGQGLHVGAFKAAG
jgi:hypothetical protein